MSTSSKNIGRVILFALPLILYSQNQVWARRYGSSDVDRVEDMAVDRRGNIYVAGELGENIPDSDFIVLCYDGSGNLRWVRRYNGSGDFPNSANAVLIDSSGHIYVTGQCDEALTDWDYLTIKYDSLGDTLWLRRYDNSAADLARDITIDVLGNIYVTGSSWEDSEDIVTVKYDASGNEKWVRRYDGPSQYYDMGSHITADRLGNIFVLGLTYKNTDVDFVTIRYDSLGNMRWVRFYNGSADSSYDCPGALFADGFGNVYVTGLSAELGTGTDFTTIKYDSSGNAEWIRKYNGPANRYDSGSDIIVAPSGNIYVIGSSESSTNRDLTLIKYTDLGIERWVRRYNGSANLNDYGYSLILDQCENIYVTGYSQESGTGTDYITIKYDSLGFEKWRAYFQRDSADWATKVAIDPDGYVYVTGASDTTNRFRDFVTIKYTNPVRIEETSYSAPVKEFKVRRIGHDYSFTIDFITPQPLAIRVFDVSGRQRIEPVFQKTERAHQFCLDGKYLNSGIYFVSFDNNAFHRIAKVVVVK